MSYAAVPYVPGFDYCVGVDTPSGTPCGLAVSGEPTTIPGASGGLVDFSLTRITSFEDFVSQLGISASASGGFGLFSASAKMDYAKKCKVHSNSLFLLVTVKVTQATSSIKDPHILEEADKLLANGHMEEFRQRYGDMFVRGFITGGQFFGLMEIETRTTEQRESIAVEIEASYGGFFDADFKYNKEQARQVGVDSARIHCHIEGGDINKPIPVTAEDMLKRVREFPGEVSGRAVPYVGLLNGYSILATSEPPNFIDLQQQKDVLEQCAERRNNIIMVLNDIDFIMAHSDQFEDEGKAQLTKWSSDLNQDLRTIARAASAALNNSREAKFPSTAEFLVPLPLTLPKHKENEGPLAGMSSDDQEWALSLPQDKQHVLLSMPGNERAWLLSSRDRNYREKLLSMSEKTRKAWMEWDTGGHKPRAWPPDVEAELATLGLIAYDSASGSILGG